MLRLTIILLTLATAVIHLSFFVSNPAREVIYGLNALGYLVLVAMLYLPMPVFANRHRLARYGLMGYTALTVAAYIAFGIVTGDWTFPLGPVTKLIEVVLIGLLWLEDRRSAFA